MPALHHRPHDYDDLIRRWQRAARRAGLTLSPFGSADDYPLFVARNRTTTKGAPRIYFSAGIHGDEAASTEGLLAWVSENPDLVARINATIFPCLNPWGLVNNNRLNRRGRDLNRCYHSPNGPVRAHIRELQSKKFDLALTLHEDFDARGIYVYEVATRRPYWAACLLKAASAHIPVDRSRLIEGRPAARGVIRRRIRRDTMTEWPEAFLLHFGHARRTFTIETPSEFHIDQRTRAHVAVLDAAVRLALTE